MKTGELFLKIMNFEDCERCINWEFSYWGGTLNRWYMEGLPKKYGLERDVGYGETVCGPGLHYPLISIGAGYNVLVDRDVSGFFKFDDGILTFPINHWIFPKFDARVLEEDENIKKVIDEDGVTKIVKKDSSSMPYWLDWPVKDEKSWEEFKEERFQINYEERLDKNFSDYDNILKEKAVPVNLFGDPVGFYGSIRYLIGEMNLLYMYYDNPSFVKKILNFLADFWINIAEEILSRYEIKVVSFWEDMSGKNGPLIGPATFREFMSPCYKRIIDFLRSKGAEHFIVDTDGKIDVLIPLFLDAGMTGILPIERQAGNDLLGIRRKYPKLQIMGGFDKNVLTYSIKEIDIELKIIKEMIKKGGYIPFCDHLVPPNVSWSNYKYFREKLTDIIYTTKIRPNGKN
jgi:uroporphyrinogen decarboxylase